MSLVARFDENSPGPARSRQVLAKSLSSPPQCHHLHQPTVLVFVIFIFVLDFSRFCIMI